MCTQCHSFFKGDANDIADLLPVPLQSIQDVANHCLKLATGIEAEFVKVMHLTAEVLEACVSTQGRHENAIREAEATFKALEQQKKALEEEKKMNETVLQKIEKSIDDAEEQYKSAVDSIPTGWNVIGIAAVGGIIESVKGTMNLVTLGGMKAVDSVKGTMNLVSMVTSGSTKAVETLTKQGDNIGIAEEHSFNQAQSIRQHIVSLQSVVEDINIQQLANGSPDVKRHQESIIVAKVNLTEIAKKLEKFRQSGTTKKAVSICKQGVLISDQLNTMVNKWEHDVKVLETLQTGINELYEKALVFSIEADYALSNLPLAGNPPCMTQLNNKSENHLEAVLAQSQVKAQMASAHLNHMREIQEKKMDSLKESNRDLGEVLGKMEQLDLQKIDFGTIKKTLRDGIIAISELRIQWSKLVKFFQMMANLIECSMHKTLSKFLEYSKKGEDKVLQGYPMSNMHRDLIYMQAFQASSIAHLVHMLSESYCDISRKYVMPKISGLDKLFAFDADKDKGKIELKRNELFRGCREAQRAIGDMLDKKKRDYDNNLGKRLKEIETELIAVLPPATPAIQIITQRAIAAGTTAGVKLEPSPTDCLNVDNFC